MNFKYTVEEFIEMWDKDEIEISDIIVRKYAPVLEKKMILDIMIEKSEYTNSGNITYLDPFLLKINYVAAIILLYTCLDIDHNDDDDKTFYNDYDLLSEKGIIRDLIEKLTYTDSNEIDELNDIFEKLIQSYNERNYSILSILSRVNTVLSENINSLVDYIGSLDDVKTLLKDEKTIE